MYEHRKKGIAMWYTTEYMKDCTIKAETPCIHLPKSLCDRKDDKEKKSASSV